MQLAGDGALGHLTYCTNIHAAEHWQDVETGLARHLPAIKRAISPDAPMGVGLRIAASAAKSLTDPANFESLRALLGRDYYVFTINGFPYGTFHGQRVKDGAYRPDWSEPERLAYTNLLADQLAALLPDSMTGSVSTVPCTFKPWLENNPRREGLLDAIVEHLLQHAAHLVKLGERSGRTIVLALEPEPFCLLETIDETIAFFESSLFCQLAVTRLAALTGLGRAATEDALHRHLGVCYDVCHAAVEFEDPVASVESLRAAGIDIAKLQLSSALEVSSVDATTAAALRAFDEPVYLHQTVQRRDGQITRFVDLDEALERIEEAIGAQWRSHFHVPIFLEEMEQFSTTQDFLRAILALHLRSPISTHLEVETYTWDVLPEQYRNVDLGRAIARELAWVRTRLEDPSAHGASGTA
ncbi:MAG: metabolite traffic protein EboE [Gammaproteobacteria bacterium]|nr:MAG: metabolite traffic protein EboE [Gammaproteobacteria bacterium]